MSKIILKSRISLVFGPGIIWQKVQDLSGTCQMFYINLVCGSIFFDSGFEKNIFFLIVCINANYR